MVMNQVAFEEETLCRNFYVGGNWNERWKELMESVLFQNGEALICKWKYLVFGVLWDRPLFPFVFWSTTWYLTEAANGAIVK